MKLRSLREVLEPAAPAQPELVAAPDSIPAREQEILSAMPKGVQMTDREICYALGQGDMNYVRPHVTRMVRSGLLAEGPKRKCIVTSVLVRTTVNYGEAA